MYRKIAALLGVALLASACETTPEETGDAMGEGQAAEQAPAPAVETERTVTPMGPHEALASEGDRVFFDFDRHDLRPEGQAALRRQAALLRANPGLAITISGHCDERGTREYNLALGERRATAAKNFLVEAGVDAARIATRSYGKDRPIVLGHTEAAWAQNRVAITSLN